MKYFIDFEAAQFSNRIISIGCVRENGDKFYSLVNPSTKITPFITDLTGITNEMSEQAPYPEEVFSKFFDWCMELEDDLPQFYCYGNCDTNFVKKNFSSCKNFKAKAILGYLYSDLFNCEPFIRSHFGVIQPISLIKITSYYKKEEITQTHNALEDAKMLKYVFEQIQLHSKDEDSNAFPEYKSNPIYDPTVDWNKYRVHRFKDGKKVETFETLTEAVEWVFDHLPDNGQKEQVHKKNLGNKIKNASNKNIKYINYKWKVEKK